MFQRCYAETPIVLGSRERKEIEFVNQWIFVLLLLIYLPYTLLSPCCSLSSPLPLSLPSLPFFSLPYPPPPLALALIFPSLSNASILSCKSAESLRANGCFKILASCNLSITRFRPACHATRGGYKETSVFRWPFWIFHKASECQLNTQHPFDPSAPTSQQGSRR